MLVHELRRTLLERVEHVAAKSDEEVAAQVLTHARTILVALAGHPGDEEVSLQELTVGTQTAALIMGMHRESVRSLVRQGRLPGTKTNGEFQIPLSAVADYKLKTPPSEWGPVGIELHYGDVIESEIPRRGEP